MWSLGIVTNRLKRVLVTQNELWFNFVADDDKKKKEKYCLSSLLFGESTPENNLCKRSIALPNGNMSCGISDGKIEILSSPDLEKNSS